MLSKEQALKLRTLINAERCARADLASYQAWRHIEPEVMNQYHDNVYRTNADLNKFINSITRKKQ